MNLVDLLRPTTLVELGTHAGDSYCAFCQAVDELQTLTRCYAIDTWRGDAHAGAYGDEVLAELRAFHDPLYSAFSRLVQSTFADAVRHFGDGSVGLLHIDGLHTYAAVREDFEVWAPKLSPRAVVLFHDINVRERDFGVWKLWAELSARHPHFEFRHGHGLGVLAPGGAPPGVLQPLLEATEADATAVRVVYSELGRRITTEKALATANVAIEQLTRDREARDRDIAALREEVDRTWRRLEAASEREQASGDLIAETRAEAQRLATELADARKIVAAIEGSRAWHLLQRYRQVRDQIVPEGSLRRRLYDRGLGSDRSD
jgi:hypothetical protein